MSRDEARILISDLIEWYTEDLGERLGLSMGKETYMDALEVLWHGPEGELISRADAIEAVHDACNYCDTCNLKDIGCSQIQALSALPSADAKGRVISAEKLKRMKFVVIKGDKTEEAYRTGWNGAIDCVIGEYASAEAVQGEWRTGKPTKGGKYIVTLIGIGGYRFVSIMHYDKPFMPNIEVSGACWYRDDDEWGDVVYDDKDILAWMPLPTPYKGGGDE